MLDIFPSSILFLLFFVVQGVSAAMGAMDAIALIIGLAILIFGICALIGYYARRRSGQ
jgi:threonine/homoserine/homoserine lactone efflux protein